MRRSAKMTSKELVRIFESDICNTSEKSKCSFDGFIITHEVLFVNTNVLFFSEFFFEGEIVSVTRGGLKKTLRYGIIRYISE